MNIERSVITGEDGQMHIVTDRRASPLGALITDFMEKGHLNQVQFGKLTGIAPPAVSELLRDNNSRYLSSNVLLKISETLDTNPFDLFDVVRNQIPEWERTNFEIRILSGIISKLAEGDRDLKAQAVQHLRQVAEQMYESSIQKARAES